MASLEMRIISEILRTRTLKEAIVAGLREDYFKDPEALAIYQYISAHYNNRSTMRQMPLLDDIRARFRSFDMVYNDPEAGTIASMISSLRMAAQSNDVLKLANTFYELAQEDHDKALNLLVAHIPSIMKKYKAGKGFTITDIAEGVKSAYEGVKNGTALGIPWPWECLTKDTLGKNKGDFIVFYGRMKSLKTWLMLKCAVDDYLLHNQRVLIWSREMDSRKLQLRLGSLIAGVDYQLLKNGDLPRHLYQKAIDILQGMSEQFIQAESDHEFRAKMGYADLVVLCGTDAPKDLNGVKGAIERYQPDIVYLDSFYHLETARAEKVSAYWNKIQYLSEDIKSLALDLNIPIVGAAQANRIGEKLMGENLTEMAGGDAIAREADLVIRVIKGKNLQLNEPEYENVRRHPMISICQKRPWPDLPVRTGAELTLILPGNREGVLEAFKIHAIPGYNFTVIESRMSSDEAREQLVKDDQETNREIQRAAAKKANVNKGARMPKDTQPDIPVGPIQFAR